MRVRKYIIVSLLLCILSGCDYTIISTKELQDDQQKLTELQTKEIQLKENIATTSLTNQENCTKQAETFADEYTKMYQQGIGKVGKVGMSNFQDHYNITLSKCMVLTTINVTSTGGIATANIEEIHDAYDRDIYAQYECLAGKPCTCKRWLAGEAKDCRNGNGFHVAAKEYMDEIYPTVATGATDN